MHLSRFEGMVTLQGVSIALWRVRCIVSVTSWVTAYICCFNRRVACEMHPSDAIVKAKELIEVSIAL